MLRKARTRVRDRSMTRWREVLEVAPAGAAGVGDGGHPDAEGEPVRIDAVVAGVGILLAGPGEDVDVDVDQAGRHVEPRRVHDLERLPRWDALLDRGDLPSRDGHVAHGAQAAGGIDHVPVPEEQVVSGLRRRRAQGQDGHQDETEALHAVSA